MDEPQAPADLVPQPTRRERLAWYAGAVALSVLLVFGGLRLDRVDLRAPLQYEDDVLLILPMVKTTLERGSHWKNERLGYPGIQELNDFPVVDHLHFAILWLMGRVISNYVVVFNLYFLMTWPLTALTAMWAFRHLKLTLPMAAAGGLLYAFLPYHYLRGESHYFLSAYWLIPLSWLPALAIGRGEPPFFRRDASGKFGFSLTRREAILQVVLAAATATAGAYYAFFACAIYCAAGAYTWIAYRTWRAAAAAAILIGVIGFVGILQHLPSIAYAMRFEPNSVAQRYPEEAETFGLKIVHLVLPVDGHNLIYLGRIKSGYNSGMRPLNNENTSASLGLVGSAGFLLLLGMLLVPGRRGWPYGPLVFLNACILLFATIGGLGAIYNLLISAQVRCLNRLSIYLAFICLFAALWPVDRFLATRIGWARRLRYPALIGLVGLGIADQTPSAWFTSQIVAITEKQQDRFRDDREFFQAIEDRLLSGPRNPLEPDAPPRVYTLPYIQYPEVPALHDLGAYEPARGYLHTNAIVWSHGAMKNREADAWQRDVAFDRADKKEYAKFLVARLVYRGFDGVFVDTRGYAIVNENLGQRLVRDIKAVAGLDGRLKDQEIEIIHKHGQQFFIDLRPYRDWLWKLDGGKSFQAWAAQERDWVAITWLQGFFSIDPNSRQDEFRRALESARAVIVNPSDRTRKFRLSMEVGVESKGEFRISVDGGELVQLNKESGPGPWFDEIVIDKKDGDANVPRRAIAVDRSYLIEVPPGRHVVRFQCRVPPLFMPGNSPAFCYYLRDIKFVEVK